MKEKITSQPAEETAPLTIGQRLLEVSRQIANIPKDSHNDYHKYFYLSANRALEVIKPLMLDHGLLLLPSCLECVEAQGLTTVKMQYEIRDAETGEALHLTFYGQGQDKSDKGVYKAYTGALKYFLFQLFMISTGDDPEADSLPRVPRRIASPEEFAAAVEKIEKLPAAPPIKRAVKLMPAKAAAPMITQDLTAPPPAPEESAGISPWTWEIEHAENKHAGKMLFMIEPKHLKDMHDHAYPDFLTIDDLAAVAAALKQPKRRQLAFELWQATQKETARLAAGAPTLENDEIQTTPF